MHAMISLFIDNELTISEKIAFVKNLQRHPSFGAEALELLEQEELIRSNVVHRVPQPEIHMPTDWKTVLSRVIRPLGIAAAAAAMILLFLNVLPPQPVPLKMNRFVVYRPDAGHIDIAGSFTNWEPLPLQKVGDSGYWEIRLAVPAGEHRFTYILEGRQTFADPTILLVEKDDFGGTNSILRIEEKA